MRNVVFVLLLVQSGMTLLAMVGELLFMGGLPFYAIVPVLRVILTLVFAALILKGHKGALIGVIALQAISLIGFALSVGVGLLPQVDFTPNLTGLFTGVILPIVVIVYCGQMLWKPSLTA